MVDLWWKLKSLDSSSVRGRGGSAARTIAKMGRAGGGGCSDWFVHQIPIIIKIILAVNDQ